MHGNFWNSPLSVLGSPADKDNLEVGDEILEVNGKTLEDATHTEVISHIHQVRSLKKWKYKDSPFVIVHAYEKIRKICRYIGWFTRCVFTPVTNWWTVR